MKQQEITVPENWEQKDRVYTLKGSKSPLTRTIPSKHTTRYPMTFFDTKLGLAMLKMTQLITVDDELSSQTEITISNQNVGLNDI